jgi:hypothetical protein
MKALMVMTLMAAGPEFETDPGYSPAPGDTALLHATSWGGRATDVVLGHDEAAYARHLEQTFRDGQAALTAAGDDPNLVVLPYGTEVVVERVVRGSVWTGRRVVERLLLSVRPVGGPTGLPSLLVLDMHVQRPLSREEIEATARAIVERANDRLRDRIDTVDVATRRNWSLTAGTSRYDRVARGERFSSVPASGPTASSGHEHKPSLDELKRENFLLEGRLYDSQRLYREAERAYWNEYRIRWLLAAQDSRRYVNCTSTCQLVISVPIVVTDNRLEDATDTRRETSPPDPH